MRGYRTYYSSLPFNYKRERIVHIGCLNYTKAEALSALPSVQIPHPYIHSSVDGFEIRTDFSAPRVILVNPPEDERRWLNLLIGTLRIGPKKFSSTSYFILEELEKNVDFLLGVRHTIKEAMAFLGDRNGRIAQVCYLTTRREIDCVQPEAKEDLFEIENKYGI